MNFASLGKVANVSWGNTNITKASYVSSGFVAYSAAGPDGFLPQAEHYGPGIVLSAIGSVGNLHYADGEWTAIKNTITITPLADSPVDFRFLYRYLNRGGIWRSRGGTQQFIGLGTAKEVQVQLPPLPEQRRIAAILDKSDELRKKRRATLEQLDALPQSIFFEMFGDPRAEGCPWSVVALENVCHKIVDGTHKTPTYTDSGVPFVTVKNISSGELTLEGSKFISEEEHALLTKRVKPEAGDVLVSKDGTIGIACTVRTDSAFSIFVSVALLKVMQDIVDPMFLTHQFRTDWIQAQVRAGTKGIAIRHLHLEDFRKLKVLMPPLPMQQDFVKRVANVERVKGSYAASRNYLGALFSSLEHQAFSGAR